MDFSTAIEYERAYPVKIKSPDGAETGITINVISKDSKRAVAALREFQIVKMEQALADGRKEDTLRDKVDLIDGVNTETIIACVDSWDWGEHSFGKVSGSGKATREDVEFLVSHPHSGWIVGQIAGQIERVENFMHPSLKSA